MIDREELRRIHSQDVPLHVLEQDYIQALFLQEYYSENEKLVFKGGTFLRHAHGLDRFSEDLDFTAKEEDVLEGLKNAAENLSDYGVEAEIDKIEEKEISLNCRLKYRGPLYQGSEKSIGTIDIEISKREDVFLDPKWTRLFFEYPEIRVVNALGLAKKELLAEKLRALTGRNKPRDLYDCWFLIKQDVELDRELFEKKIEVVDGNSDVSIEVTEDMWENDLNLFLEYPPGFQQVLDYVEESLENKGFTVRTE